MSNDGTFEVEGEVVEHLPNTQFRVKIADNAAQLAGQVVLCYLTGRMRKNYIKVMPGDRVTVEMTRYDQHRGRIIYRL